MNSLKPTNVITPADISATHRLPSKQPNKTKHIIVRLKDRTLRQDILSKQKELKGTGRSIAEDMTRENVHLLKDAEDS
jgi:hypothetical protein